MGEEAEKRSGKKRSQQSSSNSKSSLAALIFRRILDSSFLGEPMIPMIKVLDYGWTVMFSKALLRYEPSLIHKLTSFNIFCSALFSRGHVLNSKINTRMIMVDKGKMMKKQRRCYPPGSGIFKPWSINSIMSSQPSKHQYRVIARMSLKNV